MKATSNAEQKRSFRALFSAPEGRWLNAPRSEGGVGHDSDKKYGKAAFLYLSHSVVVIPC